MTAVRIGINPLTWSNDDMPELGADIPLERCLREGREAGYEGFELGHKFPRDAAVLGPLLAAHQLSLVSGWYSCRLLERDVDAEIVAVQSHLALLRELGCTVMVCAEVSRCIHGEREQPLSRRPQMDSAEWALFCARLSAFAEHLQGYGMQLAYHHHMGTVVQSASDIDRLLAQTGPAVKLLLDAGHLSYAGDDPLACASRHADRIVHVHCKDVRAAVLARAQQRDQSFLDAVLAGVFTVPGDGAVDFAALFAILSANGYRGWLVVEAEQDPAQADPLTYARMGYRHLSALRREYFPEHAN